MSLFFKSSFSVRMVLKINPPAMHSILERIAAEEEEENDGHYQEEEEGGAHSLKDVCDLRRPAPSPFSSRRVMFENEQVNEKPEPCRVVIPVTERCFFPFILPSPRPFLPFLFVSQVSFELVSLLLLSFGVIGLCYYTWLVLYF